MTPPPPAPPTLASAELASTQGKKVQFYGELRERFEHFSAPGLGLHGEPADGYVLHRLLFAMDARLAPKLRVFVQLGNHTEFGKTTPRSPADVDRLDVEQAYFDLAFVDQGDHGATLRVGRYEMPLGSQRLVSLRDTPNVRRSFDGVQLLGNLGSTRIDAFWARPVLVAPGTFDNRPNSAQALYGVYATLTPAPDVGWDVYYLGFDNEFARYGGVGGIEHRYSLGTRFFGQRGGWDWNAEVVAQSGRFGPDAIRAWTVSSDTGFTFRDARWSPRLGLKADVASGDRDPGDARLETFNPLFPKLSYFSEAALIAPLNLINVEPTLGLKPRPNLKVALGWSGAWRQTTRDAVYLGALVPVAGTAGHGGRQIAHQAFVDLDWQATAKLQLRASLVNFRAAQSLRDAGAHSTGYLMLSATYKF